MTRKTLPKKLSDCVELALKDLAQVERMKRTYTVYMETWHRPNGKCAVCFAGAVIARTLGVSPETYANPTHFNDATEARLEALNDIRTGFIHDALKDIRRRPKLTIPSYVKVSDYDAGTDDHAKAKRGQFKRDMRKIVKLLRSAGE